MMKMQPPQLLNDLYQDLRDRRLLLPAAALLVALVGVLALLPSSPRPPAEPGPIAAEPTAASPAVLAEQIGIRNYRQRLQALQEKNPFDQKFAVPDPSSIEVAEPAGGATAGIADSPDLGDRGSGPPSAPSPAISSAGAGPSTPGAEPQAQPQPDERPARAERRADEQAVEEITKMISRRVDVRIGPAGEARKVKDVRALDFLPSGKVPVTAFLGVNENGKRAAFLVSSDIVASDGDGRCVPAPPAQCYFLVLREDEQRRLVYQPEGEEPTVYVLKLLRIRDVVVKSLDR